MKKSFILTGILLFSITALIIADAHISGFKVLNDPNGNIKIEWRTTYENDVAKFILQRKTDQTNWVTIKEFQPQGSGSYYSYTDYAAYKTTDVTFSYRLGIKNSSDNQIAYLTDASINQKVSGFKQTWGSIKAMFR